MAEFQLNAVVILISPELFESRSPARFRAFTGLALLLQSGIFSNFEFDPTSFLDPCDELNRVKRYS